MSNELNNNLAVTSFDFLKSFDRLYSDFIFLALCIFGYLDKFMMVSYLTLLPLCEEFARGVHFECCYILFRLRYLPFHLNFADDTIFKRDIARLTGMQMILELYEEASS